MNTTQAVQRLRDVIRRQHKALATEESYVQWLRRYMAAIRHLPNTLTSEQKLERFLTQLAREHDEYVRAVSPAVLYSSPMAHLAIWSCRENAFGSAGDRWISFRSGVHWGGKGSDVSRPARRRRQEHRRLAQAGLQDHPERR
jgi:hypothetical protein